MSFQQVEEKAMAQLRIIEPSALSRRALATARSFLTGPELIRCDSLVSGQARRNFTIAHTADVVAVVASRCGPIAVDCEECPPRTRHRDAMARLLPSGENKGDDREAVKRWTIHECLVKLGRRELDDQQPVRRSAHPQ